MKGVALPARHTGADLLQVVTHQCGVLTRGQLLGFGIDSDRVRNEVAGRRWQVVGSRVVILHNGPPTQAQLLWTACLATGPHAILDGSTAATAAGLRSYDTDTIHVSVPKGSGPRSTSGVVVHELRRYAASDVHPQRSPPQARAAVALMNAAFWSPSADRACAILAAGVQQRLVRAADLREPLARLKRHPFRRVLTSTLGDIEGGSQSLSEIDLVRLCRSYRLPEPSRQSIRPDSHVRRRYLDADWDEYGMSAEVDGGLHMLARTWWDDMDRLNELVLADRRVLRFPSVVIRLYPNRVAAQLERGLRQGGWRP